MANTFPALFPAALALALGACGPGKPSSDLVAQAVPAGSPVRCALDVRKADNRAAHIVCDVTADFILNDVVLNGGLCATPFDEDVSLADADDDPRYENSSAVKRPYKAGERIALVLPRDCALTQYIVVSDKGEWAFNR